MSCENLSTEAVTQKTREADKFSYYVPGGQQTPWNPLKEVDELYCKDNKVPLIDLEVFAKEHIKNVEEKKFNIEMGKLQKELDQLEAGKYLANSPSARLVSFVLT